MKVAMFGHKKIPSRDGGIEIVVDELGTRLVENGISVTCFNRSDHFRFSREFKTKQKYHGMIVKQVPTIDVKGMAAITSSFFAAVNAAIGKFDIVHIHAEGPAIFCWIPKLFHKKVVVTVHGLDWMREKWHGGIGAKVIHMGEKSAVKYADEIIVLSDNVKKYFYDTYKRSTHMIPNGVCKPVRRDVNKIKEMYGLNQNTYILFLGRLVPEKGISYLIKAFKQVDTNLKLVIAGGSSDTDEYERNLKDMSSDDSRILFTGFVQGEVMDELYSNAYLYVLPSDLEGMPLSLLEAMSYGNCCLVSDIKEMTEVVEDKAVIFPKSNVQALTNSLQNLFDHPETVERYKGQSAEYICQKYNWNEVTDKTIAIYRNVKDHLDEQ